MHPADWRKLSTHAQTPTARYNTLLTLWTIKNKV